ncbi:DinB family protein [Armatimonas rosea]|uniref:Putative damage-inducible protein DinB n=1 Tax=Armatimonas rosea TaxID=685828 RepID=A0A7W9SX48_ARMRO|nr:DinB family protein [Armatimonas rosea]MBB6054053.1 putative damage-inducible protein DinB [Armatimonas rosea]
MDSIANTAQSHVRAASERVIHLMSFVPDDRLSWAPSPTSRSFLQVVAHIASTNRAFAQILSDEMPEEVPSPDDFFRVLRVAEERITTREDAIADFTESTEELRKAMSSLTAENIATDRRSPFGPMPAQAWLDIVQGHIEGHRGQLEFLQTLWGDLDQHRS